MKLIARIAISSIGVVIGTAVGGLLGFIVPMLLGLFLLLLGGGIAIFASFLMIFTIPLGVVVGAIGGGYLANRLADRLTPVLNRSSPLARWTVRTVIAGIAAYVVGGFVAGALIDDDPLGPPNLMQRLFEGVSGCTTFIVSPGRVETSMGELINAWPHFFVCWIVFFLAIACWARYGEVNEPEIETDFDLLWKRMRKKFSRRRNFRSDE